MAKPWRCRLRLHSWEERENPDTQERYQVCPRCNAIATEGMQPQVPALLESPLVVVVSAETGRERPSPAVGGSAVSQQP
jgi:hypothetical protein